METKTSIVLSRNSEDELLHFLKQRYGPYDESEALDLLRSVKMPTSTGRSPYADEGPFVTFMYDFSDTLEWVHLKRPSEKCLVEVFLAGIQPTLLRQKLKDRDFKTLEAVALCFHGSFEKNVKEYLFLQSQGAFDRMRIVNFSDDRTMRPPRENRLTCVCGAPITMTATERW